MTNDLDPLYNHPNVIGEVESLLEYKLWEIGKLEKKNGPFKSLRQVKKEGFNAVDDFLGTHEYKKPSVKKHGLLNLGKYETAMIIGIPLTAGILYDAGTQLMFESMQFMTLVKLGIGSKLAGVVGSNLKMYSDRKDQAFYKPSFNQIVVPRDIQKRQLNAIAHEYTHSIQIQKGLDQFKSRAYLEGHARGVDYHVSRREFDIEALKESVEMSLSSLKRVYSHFALLQNKNTDPSLTMPLRKYDHLGRIEEGLISHHDLGCALFFLREKQEGLDIYRTHS